MIFLADLILIMHFMVAAFVALGLLIIPVGTVLSWQWVRGRIFRTVHAGLMIYVAFEAVVGLICPLTIIEAYLRGTHAHESFIAHHVNRLLYWDLSLSSFLKLYIACAIWVIGLWVFCPPYAEKSD